MSHQARRADADRLENILALIVDDCEIGEADDSADDQR